MLWCLSVMFTAEDVCLKNKKFRPNFNLSVSVNKYELMTLEQLNQGLTEERMVLAFQALDELIPKLGVYSRLFSKLRDDFFS